MYGQLECEDERLRVVASVEQAAIYSSSSSCSSSSSIPPLSDACGQERLRVVSQSIHQRNTPYHNAHSVDALLCDMTRVDAAMLIDALVHSGIEDPVICVVPGEDGGAPQFISLGDFMSVLRQRCWGMVTTEPCGAWLLDNAYSLFRQPSLFAAAAGQSQPLLSLSGFHLRTATFYLHRQAFHVVGCGDVLVTPYAVELVRTGTTAGGEMSSYEPLRRLAKDGDDRYLRDLDLPLCWKYRHEVGARVFMQGEHANCFSAYVWLAGADVAPPGYSMLRDLCTKELAPPSTLLGRNYGENKTYMFYRAWRDFIQPRIAQHLFTNGFRIRSNR